MTRLRGPWQAVLIPLGLALIARGVAHLQAVTEARVAEILDLDTRIAQRREQLGLLDLMAEATTSAKLGAPEPASPAPAEAVAEP